MRCNTPHWKGCLWGWVCLQEFRHAGGCILKGFDLPTDRSIHPSTIDRFISPFFHFSISLALHLYPFVYLSGYLRNDLSVSVYLSIDRSIYSSMYLFSYLSIYLSIHPSVPPSIHLLIYGSMCQSLIYPSIHPAVYHPVNSSAKIRLHSSNQPLLGGETLVFAVAGHVA